MKKLFKVLISTLLAAMLSVPFLCSACSDPSETNKPDYTDYVGGLKLDFASNTKKQEVTVRLYVDGDTTHFDPVTNSTLTGYNASDFEKTEGYLKARYIAINTPESTGKIEPWGKKASNFTHSKLENAETIVVESDDSSWHLDSTGGRYLLWVWYKPKGEAEFRNLNVEILQEGLAIASNTDDNRYGEIAFAALTQAEKQKLFVHSDEKDPNFFYGSAIPLTIKELRSHVSDYDGKKVKVEGVITTEFNNSVYIEDFDPDTGVYFGFAVYYGFTTGAILDVLSIGNKVSVVGTVTEFQGSWQISGISYNEFEPTAPSNTTVISTGHSSAFVETSVSDIISGKLNVEFDEETVTMNYGEAIMSSTVTISNVMVTKVYTTSQGNSKGAMSLTCRTQDGATITVRTEVLKDADGNVITSDRYNGKNITVKGIVEKFDGEYQIKCYRANFITINN